MPVRSDRGWKLPSVVMQTQCAGRHPWSLEYAQDKKTEHYKSIVEQAAEARPGVLKLMDECLDHPDVAVCICSAATKEGFIKPLACQTFLSTMWHAHT
eukprot:scaffold231986_cov20-Tisochrysis_lutea.AAC.4